MQPSQWEVVILKPTSIFLSFLASQISEQSAEIKLPGFPLLQTDNTAYLMPKQASDEDTLDLIEKYFPFMFKHEITRWLGDMGGYKIENNFLDFLCCFKFELHSHLLLMEESIQAGHQLLRVKPRSVLLRWMKSAVEEQEELVDILEKINLSRLAENATVIIKNFKTLEEVKPFLSNNYKAIVEAEMLRMCDNESQWPNIDSCQAFFRYFSIEIHTQLIHLT